MNCILLAFGFLYICFWVKISCSPDWTCVSCIVEGDLEPHATSIFQLPGLKAAPPCLAINEIHLECVQMTYKKEYHLCFHHAVLCPVLLKIFVFFSNLRHPNLLQLMAVCLSRDLEKIRLVLMKIPWLLKKKINRPGYYTQLWDGWITGNNFNSEIIILGSQLGKN